MTTQNPRAVWLALPRGTRTPVIRDRQYRFVRVSGAAATAGVVVERVAGIDLQVYDLEKTIADCFKFRRLVGLDVAIEALRDAIGQRRVRPDKLWEYAEIDRVTATLRPYAEALL